MISHTKMKIAMIAGVIILSGAHTYAADSVEQTRIERAVNEAIRPVMEEHKVPGMAVGVTVRGKTHFFN